jgi:hypothetical protein
VQLASVGRRIGAFFLAILLYVLTLGIGYVIWGLIVWGRGQTPALQVLGMRCWRPETQRVAGWWWMALREIVGGFIESFFSFIGVIASFTLIAGTVVLNDPHNVLTLKKGLDGRPSQFPPFGPISYPNNQQFGGGHAELGRVADTYESKYGPHFVAPDGTWSGLGDAIRRAEVLVYRVGPEIGFGFGKGARFSQTRWSF